MTSKKQFAPREYEPEREAVAQRINSNRREDRQIRNDLRSLNVERLMDEFGDDDEDQELE